MQSRQAACTQRHTHSHVPCRRAGTPTRAHSTPKPQPTAQPRKPTFWRRTPEEMPDEPAGPRASPPVLSSTTSMLEGSGASPCGCCCACCGCSCCSCCCGCWEEPCVAPGGGACPAWGAPGVAFLSPCHCCSSSSSTDTRPLSLPFFLSFRPRVLACGAACRAHGGVGARHHTCAAPRACAQQGAAARHGAGCGLALAGWLAGWLAHAVVPLPPTSAGAALANTLGLVLGGARPAASDVEGGAGSGGSSVSLWAAPSSGAGGWGWGPRAAVPPCSALAPGPPSACICVYSCVLCDLQKFRTPDTTDDAPLQPHCSPALCFGIPAWHPCSTRTAHQTL